MPSRAQTRVRTGQDLSGVKRTGIRLMPLMKFERKRSTGPASSMSGRRRSSSSNMIWISRRARLAPRQKWCPMPKARCSFGVRPTSKRSACGKTSSSRLAEPYQTVSLSPSRIGWPRSSASRVAVRRKYMTGETQRSISSTAVGMRDGSASSRRRSSGCCIRASMPPEIRLRVVSLPATASSRKKESNSTSVSFSPSTSAAMRTLTRSSRGVFFRSTASSLAYMYICIEAIFPTSELAPPYSGSSKPIMSLLHLKIRCRSASGMPIISAITWRGSSAAISATKSHSPRAPTAPMLPAALSRRRANASWGQPARKRSGFARSTPGSRMGASGAPAEQGARRPETEELRDRALEKASLAGDGGWAARVLLHHRLEEGGVGEVAEDQVIEARPQVGELARLPGAPRAGQDGEPLRVERSQEAREGAPLVAVVVEAGALDETREVRMLLQIVEHAVQDGLHHRRLEAAALAPGPALAALRDQRDDRRDAPGEDRLVQRPLVAEVMVEARLVLEPRLGGYLPHRYAGEAALGEAPLGGVEDGVARGRGFAGAGGGRPGAHAPPRTRTNVRLSRECPPDRVPRAAG